MKKVFSILSLFIFSVLLGNVVSAYTGMSPAITVPSIGSLVVFSSKFVHQGVFAYSSADLSEISRYANQFQKKLIATLVNGLDIFSDIMVMPNVKTSMKLPKLTVGDGFRPYSGSTEFQSGDVVYGDRELKVSAGKREILIDPEDYRNTYLSQILSAGSGAREKKIPFAQFLWDQVIKSTQREVNDEVAYFGFDKSDATAYSGAATYNAGDYITYTQNNVLHYFLCLSNTSAGESPDSAVAKWQKVTARAVVPGLKKVIEDEIIAGNLAEITIGVIDNATNYAHESILSMFRAADVSYKKSGIITHCSYTDWELLLDDLKTQFQYTVTDISRIMQNGMLPLPLTEGKCFVKPATWLGSSRRLINEPLSTIAGKGANLHIGTDLMSDLNQIATKENLWTLEAGIKAVLGFQIADLDAIWVNDQV